MQEPGPKIFFLLSSFVFMIGCLATLSVISYDSNLTEGINDTVGIMLLAFGFIFFIIFAYILIKQIIVAMDMLREKKGYEPDY